VIFLVLIRISSCDYAAAVFAGLYPTIGSVVDYVVGGEKGGIKKSGAASELPSKMLFDEWRIVVLDWKLARQLSYCLVVTHSIFLPFIPTNQPPIPLFVPITVISQRLCLSRKCLTLFWRQNVVIVSEPLPDGVRHFSGGKNMRLITHYR